MRFELTQSFFKELERYSLHYTCEHCVHFEPALEQCAHGYPNHEHRDWSVLEPGAELVFCKEFELA